MTTDDSMELLRYEVKRSSQAEVARRLGYSPSAVNQALRGTYGAGLANLLERVQEQYGNHTVTCPVLGDIRLSRCTYERCLGMGKAATTSPQRIALFRACKACTIRKNRHHLLKET